VLVCVPVDVAVGVEVGVSVGRGVVVCVGVGVREGVHVTVGVKVCVAVGVIVGVAVRVGVFVGAVTINDAAVLVDGALVAKVLTVLTKVWNDGGAAVAFTVIVALAPIPRLGIRTSKLVAVHDVTVPAVVVTLLITIHDGKSVSLTTTPVAAYAPGLVTVTV
jgi:hypothetical protein